MSGGPAARVETLEPDGPVALRDIEGALLELRRSIPCHLDADDDERPDQPITRACMSNLIVYCESASEARALQAELAALGHVHPARMIVLVADPDGSPRSPVAELATGLSDHAQRRQVSSEQIRIEVAGGDPVRIAAAARPLLIGDLPTALWWNATTPPAQAGGVLSELVEMASSLVYDSRGWKDPARGLFDMANWVLDGDRQVVVADLAWMRQRGWRSLMSEVLAPRLLPGALEHIESMRLEHGPHALPLVALFIGWLAHALGWRVESARARSASASAIRFRGDHGAIDLEVVRRSQGSSDLELARIETRVGGDPIEIQFDSISEDRISVRIGDGAQAENFVHLPRERRIASLARQLANRSGDPAFRTALAMARSIAREYRR